MIATNTKKRKTREQLVKEFRDANKLWKLLKIGLADLLACERSKKFEVNMTHWVSDNYLGRGKCVVCLAGACLAQHLNVKSMMFGPGELGEYDQDASYKAEQLNSLRQGKVPRSSDYDRDVPDYHEDRKGFWAAMRKLLVDLKKANI